MVEIRHEEKESAEKESDFFFFVCEGGKRTHFPNAKLIPICF